MRGIFNVKIFLVNILNKSIVGIVFNVSVVVVVSYVCFLSFVVVFFLICNFDFGGIYCL